MSNGYRWEAYCDICKTGLGEAEYRALAYDDRQAHFEQEHRDNPMVKQNCRIRRIPVDE